MFFNCRKICLKTKLKKKLLQLFLLNFLGLLSPDGRTKSFDNEANGFARGESVVAVFLQRAKDAKRIYAQVKSIISIPGPTDDRLPAFYPTSEVQANVLRKSLMESQLSGKDINFVEADGLGIKETDAQEIKAIDLVFNEGRKSPLLIGSVKTNIGYCSNSNSLNAIVKVNYLRQFCFFKFQFDKFKYNTSFF